MILFPNPSTIFPIPDQTCLCFLKNIITHPNIIIGDYTYYFDPEDIHNFSRNIVYHYEYLGDKLIIGKFCQIGSHVRFIMNGGNHRHDGVSSYPFHAIAPACAGVSSLGKIKKDTVVGHDVWIGHGVTVLPGVSIGNGAIIGAASVVTKDVLPYTIVGGNPAREIRKRFDEKTVLFIQKIAWWHWPIEKITLHAEDLVTGNINKLKNAGI